MSPSWGLQRPAHDRQRRAECLGDFAQRPRLGGETIDSLVPTLRQCDYLGEVAWLVGAHADHKTR